MFQEFTLLRPKAPHCVTSPDGKIAIYMTGAVDYLTFSIRRDVDMEGRSQARRRPANLTHRNLFTALVARAVDIAGLEVEVDRRTGAVLQFTIIEAKKVMSEKDLLRWRGQAEGQAMVAYVFALHMSNNSGLLTVQSRAHTASNTLSEFVALHTTVVFFGNTFLGKTPSHFVCQQDDSGYSS
jgi:hypothetical protein